MTTQKDDSDSPSPAMGSTVLPTTEYETKYTTAKVKIWTLDRLEHFTWAWFTLPMSAGGIALLLSPRTQGHTFPGLLIIGKTVYVIDLVIFVLSTVAITYRFCRWPSSFKNSITHPTEGLFVATFFLSIASIITAISHYGIVPAAATGTWLITTYRVLFWIYFAVTFLTAVGHYFLLFTSPLLKIEDMTPAWDLPIFPFMLSGTIAASGAVQQPAHHAISMIIAGLTAQGLGMMISVLMYASYFRRMIQFGFPSVNSRPAMFIAVGPPSFTSLALIGMANNFPSRYAAYFGQTVISSDMTSTGTGTVGTAMDNETMTMISLQIMRVIATSVSIFIWSLSAWFFCIALLACLAGIFFPPVPLAFVSASSSSSLATATSPAATRPKTPSETKPATTTKPQTFTFHLNWYAMIFPNTGLTIATITIGKTLHSPAITYLGAGLTCVLILAFCIVFVTHVHAFVTARVCWPGKDEDFYEKERMLKVEKRKKIEHQTEGKKGV